MGFTLLGLASCSVNWQQANPAPFNLDEVDGDSLDRLVFLQAEASSARAERTYRIAPDEIMAKPKVAVRKRAGRAEYEVNVLGGWHRCDAKLMGRVTDWLQLNKGDSFFIDGWVLLEETRENDVGRIVAIALNSGPLFSNNLDP
jgi:hypothetical protein